MTRDLAVLGNPKLGRSLSKKVRVVLGVWKAPAGNVQNDHTSNVASPSSKPMLKMSVAVVRKMLDAVAGSAP